MTAFASKFHAIPQQTLLAIRVRNSKYRFHPGRHSRGESKKKEKEKMRNIAGFIALAVLATCLLLAGRSSVADGNQCGSSTINSGASVVQNAVWRMEVRVDEATFNGPSIKDRLNYHWSDEAKKNYRWTSTAMPVDTGASTQLMAVSAAVIGEGIPLLERGDIVDVYVYVASHGLDYSQGRASVILQRVCAAQDKPCLDILRETQDGKVSGVEIKGGDLVAELSRSSSLLANRNCSAPKDRCRCAMAAVSH